MGDKFVALATDEQKIRALEELHGTWIGFIHGATSFAEPKQVSVTRVDTNYEDSETSFFLPDQAAILQLIGQMPKTQNSVRDDFHDFIVGYPKNDIPYIDMNKLRNSGLESYYKNISGLNVTFFGERDGAANKPNVIGKGSEFRWFTKELNNTSENTALFSKFGSGTNFGIHFNNYAPKFGSVRYCRALTPKELGYEIYYSTKDDVVEIVKLGELPSDPIFKVMPKGILRGVTLTHIYKTDKKDVKTWKVLKSLSELEQEAKAVRAAVGGI